MSIEAFSKERLKLARQRRGLFASELAGRMNVTAATVSRWEQGKAEPKESHIEALAEILDFPRSYFFGTAPASLHQAIFRSLGRMSARQRDMVLASGSQAVELDRYLDQRYDRPASHVPDCRDLAPDKAAALVRAEWGLGYQAIKNVVHVLEAHGVRVYSLAHDGTEIDAFSDWQGSVPFVFLNTQKTAERGRMDAAHELGHLVLHAHTNGGTTRVHEAEAQAFAAAFLMPEVPFLASAPRHVTPDAVLEAKQHWGVSAVAYIYRLHKLGRLPEWLYQSLCVHFKSRYPRSEPGPVRPRETSQILEKIFSVGVDGAVASRAAIARELRMPRYDLDAVTFGLVLSASPSPSPVAPPPPPAVLRLLR